jgi:release factor glutamine methyltransferase
VTLTADVLTVGALRREVTGYLARAFAEQRREGTPALDARLLVAHALARDPATLALIDEALADAGLRRRVMVLAARRIAGEPVARITGTKEFWGLDFLLSPDTLVPRPDTETVVEAALSAIDEAGGRDRDLRLLDLGTGSGAILLALLSELPNATGVGTDRALGAVVTARENAERLGLSGRAAFVVADWADGLSGAFSVILANPPYVEAEAIESLAIEVRGHDPRAGLDGGIDGLEAYRRILGDLGPLLDEGGSVFLEVGAGQSECVGALARARGFEMRCHRDLGGVERVVQLAWAEDEEEPGGNSAKA